MAYEQDCWPRIFGYGTLIVESAGERGKVILRDVPHVERAQLSREPG